MKILSLKDIKYKTENTDILKSVSLDINEGDCVSIIGTSGSGKSTLLKVMSDLITQTEGDIFYKGKSYEKYQPEELRKQISYCIQIPYLFGDTVMDNLEYPFKIRNQNIDKEKIARFLEKLNLNESYLNKNVNSLSGGEKQRIALIRNLIFTPNILLLDEVTSGLDNENTKVVQDLIKEMNEKGITIIWITHSIDQSTSIFNKRITIEYGEIAKEENLK